jgi:hypothetical protein
VIFFFVFYSFVAGHFVPLLHKIIQTRSKKVSMSQDVASGQSDAHSSVISKTEGLVLGTLDKAISGLNACSEEVTRAQHAALLSGDKAKVSALAKTVASIQGRYLVSRGALSFIKRVFWSVLQKLFDLCFYFLWSLITGFLLLSKLMSWV